MEWDGIRIGLALGSGGTRGFAHIGVLQVLQEAGIPIHAMSGSSMGGLMAAIFATGAPVQMMEQLATHLPIGNLVDVTVPRMGLVSGERLHKLIRILTKDKTFAEADVPLAIIATDLQLGERVVFTEGPIHEAVRASIAIPGIFVPHRLNGRVFVDGGVIDRVPISAVRDIGADFVIAVDVGLFDRLPPVRHVLDVVVQSMDIMEREIFRYRVLAADFIVRPELGFMSSTAFSGIDRAIETGRAAMRDALPNLLTALSVKRKGTAL